MPLTLRVHIITTSTDYYGYNIVTLCDINIFDSTKNVKNVFYFHLCSTTAIKTNIDIIKIP